MYRTLARNSNPAGRDYFHVHIYHVEETKFRPTNLPVGYEPVHVPIEEKKIISGNFYGE